MWGVILSLVMIGWVSVCEAGPLLIRWPVYQSPLPIARFVLYRAVGATAPLHPYAVIWDTHATGYLDTAVRPNKGPYCYMLRAATADDVLSNATARVCVTPLK